MTELDTAEDETKLLSRMHLEALAQAAMREGLSPEQVAYEQWVDTQPVEEAVAWEEMGLKEKSAWCKEVLGRELGEMGQGGEENKEEDKAKEETGGDVQDGASGEVELVEEACEDKWRAERVCAEKEDECEEKEMFQVEEPAEEMVIDTGMFSCCTWSTLHLTSVLTFQSRSIPNPRARGTRRETDT